MLISNLTTESDDVKKLNNELDVTLQNHYIEMAEVQKRNQELMEELEDNRKEIDNLTMVRRRVSSNIVINYYYYLVWLCFIITIICNMYRRLKIFELHLLLPQFLLHHLHYSQKILIMLIIVIILLRLIIYLKKYQSKHSKLINYKKCCKMRGKR